MIRFVPGTQVEPLTRALWKLAVRNPAVGATDKLFDTVTALDESRWLLVDTTYAIRLHEAAELGEIGGILQDYIDAGTLPPTTNDDLAALIASKRGQMLVVWDAFPQLFKDLSKTTAEMITAGLIDDPVTLGTARKR